MSLSEAYLTEKDKEETQPVDLYEFKINGTWYYYANSRLSVSYNSHTYTAWAVRRSEVSRTADGKADKVGLSLDNTNRGFTSLMQYYRLTNCECNIRQVFRNLLTAGNDRLLFSGYLANPILDSNNFSIDVVQHIYTLQIQCPRRMYQRSCNSQFGDVSCLTYAGQADSGTTTRLNDDALDRPTNFFFLGTLKILSGANAGQSRTVNGSFTGYIQWATPLTYTISAGDAYTITWEPLSKIGLTAETGSTTTRIQDGPSYNWAVNFWRYGYVHITSGANAGQKRLIIASGSNYIDWALPLSIPVMAGDAYNLYRGCDKTLDTCRDQFHNEPNFSGFTEIADVQNLRRYGG